MLNMAKFENFKTTGIVAAPLTPFDENGEVNHGLIEKCGKYLEDHHFTGAFINGTLAEGMSMTLEERKKTAETWKKAIGGKRVLKIILHVGASNLRDSQELARHAEKLGVDAIACLCPSFFKAETEEVAVEYISRVAAEAPNTPFYYYAINFISGVYLRDDRILKLAKDKIPNLVGLKHSSREVPSAHACSLVDKKFQVLMGTDVQFLPYLSLNMEVPVTAPFMGDLFFELKTLFDKGDLDGARKYQEKAQMINTIRGKYGGGINVAKSIFKIVTGINAGSVRLPLSQLTKEQEENLKNDLDASGVFK